MKYFWREQTPATQHDWAQGKDEEVLEDALVKILRVTTVTGIECDWKWLTATPVGKFRFATATDSAADTRVLLR